jgi:predicted RNA-binding Zn ribbon-like protein
MSSYAVDGIRLPIPVAGHVALDFCNTRAGWGTDAPKEYLQSLAHLCLWQRENGLLDGPGSARLIRAAARAPQRAAAVLRRAVRLRGALYGVLRGPATPAQWSAIRAELRAAGQQLRLVPTIPAADPRPVGGAPGVGRVPLAVLEVDPAAGLELPVLAVAWRVADLLAGPASASVSCCADPACGWLFTDPRGRRRWCSMADCGNRNKARRHAQRLRRSIPSGRD